MQSRVPRHVARPGVNQHSDVLIVGAGVAGLAAARALMSAGIEDFQLVELEAEAGGNARGHVMDGIACPLGAHYLPVPGDDQAALREWLSQIGLMSHRHGRWHAEERHLCHAPQERLWFEGEWHEGLMPPLAGDAMRDQAMLRQIQRLAVEVQAASRAQGFVMPMTQGRWTAGHEALDAQTFATWLSTQGIDDAGLLGYLDYACRDDFGAGIGTVSAWAGLHYFASRHGFKTPQSAAGETSSAADDEGVFTWPEGNAWLTRRLAMPLGTRLRTRQLVTRIDATRHEVAVDVLDLNTQVTIRLHARHVVMAVPLHVAARVLRAPTALASALKDLVKDIAHAPWLVANLKLSSPLNDRSGAPPSWDNVLFNRAGTSDALGYVDASHQQLNPVRGATVLTAYWALGRDGAQAMRAQRQALLEEDWSIWSQRVVTDLSRAHPDLPQRIQQVDLMRYGHAMVIPRPGTRTRLERAALHQPREGERIVFAHSDLAGYSVFEEAFALGHRAGEVVARRMR